MGLTAEHLAQHYGISREQGCVRPRKPPESTRRQAAGRFDDEIVPSIQYISERTSRAAKAGKPEKIRIDLRADEGPRADTSAEALAKLKPVFHAQGTVTAGNSSQTSDGAAAAVVMTSDRASALGIQPLARLVAYAAAGCLPKRWAWARSRHTQSPQARRPHARRHRPHRIERSLRRAGAAVIRTRPRSQRASMSTAAPSRSAIPWAAPAPNSPRHCCANRTPQRALRHGHHVRRRRHGRRRHLRTRRLEFLFRLLWAGREICRFGFRKSLQSRQIALDLFPLGMRNHRFERLREPPVIIRLNF